MKIKYGYTLSQFVDELKVMSELKFKILVCGYNDFIKQPLQEIKPYLTKSSIDILNQFGITIPSPIIGTISELFDYCDLLELQNLEI